MSVMQYLIFDERAKGFVGNGTPLTRDVDHAKRYSKAEAEHICLLSQTFDPAGQRQVMQVAPEFAGAPAAA